jgi:hypothetical protein
MPDNVAITPGVGALVSTREVTYSGDVTKMQVVGLATLSGADDAKTPADVSADNPLPAVASRTDDLVVMLSRVVKLLESNAIVDQQQRQRIAVDSFIATIPTLTTVTTVTTLANATAIAGMDREQWINAAKSVYAQSIRARLEFV